MQERSNTFAIVKQEVNWEKIGVYITIMAAFLTVINYIVDLHGRMSKIEVKVEHLEKK